MNLKLLQRVAEYANKKNDEEEDEDGEYHGYLQGIRDAMFLVVDLIKGEDNEGVTDENDMIDRVLTGWSHKQLGD